MKIVPYHNNPGNACALACYTMVAQYLLPDLKITFEQLGKIAGWEKGYAVWPFTVWKWLMDKGVYITDYDVIDYKLWSKNGYESIKSSLPSVEYNAYKQNTYDIDLTGKQIKLAFEHKNFTYVQKKATWDDVVMEFNKPGICDLTINLNALNHLGGYASHRIVLLDITETEVIFHDPRKDVDGSNRHEPIDFFRTVFESVEGPELTRYYLDPIFRAKTEF